jgi:antitoxin ChpS
MKGCGLFFYRQINAACSSSETTGGSMDIIEKTNTTNPATKAALGAFLQRVSARSDFTGAILFCSRARGSHQCDSDADVAALLSGSPGKFVSTKLAMDDLAYEVLLETGIRIQRIQVWPSE